MVFIASSEGLSLFLLPFCIISAVCFAMVIYYLLVLLNPGVVIYMNRPAMSPGESAQLRWSVHGRLRRIDRLVISLEGREQARVSAGKNVVVEKAVFFRQVLVDRAEAVDFAGGQTTLTIPAGSMHSLDVGRLKIVWEVAARATLRRWPDVDERFALIVTPGGKA
jgi:hypothetical protein